MKSQIKKLMASNIKGAEISRQTGVSQSRISDLRNGKSDIGSLPIDQAERLVDYMRKVDEVNETAMMMDSDSEKIVGVLDSDVETLNTIDIFYTDFSKDDTAENTYSYSYATLSSVLYRGAQIFRVELYDVPGVQFDGELSVENIGSLINAMAVADSPEIKVVLSTYYFKSLIVAETYIKQMESGVDTVYEILKNKGYL